MDTVLFFLFFCFFQLVVVIFQSSTTATTTGAAAAVLPAEEAVHAYAILHVTRIILYLSYCQSIPSSIYIMYVV